MTDPQDRQATFAIKDTTAIVTGLALLIAGFAVITRLPGWIEQYGTVPVYLAYFLLMSIAGRLFWKGADAAFASIKARFGKSKNAAPQPKTPAHAR